MSVTGSTGGPTILDINADDLFRKLEQIFRGTGTDSGKKGGVSVTDFLSGSTVDKLKQAHKQATDAVKNYATTTTLSTHQQKLSTLVLKRQDGALTALNKRYKDGTISTANYVRELGSLRSKAEAFGEALGDLSNKVDKSVVDKIKAAEKEAVKEKSRQEKVEEFKESLTKANIASIGMKSSFAALGAIGGAVTKSLGAMQSGSSGAAMASDMLTSGIDLMNKGTQSVGDGLTAVGPMFKGKLGVGLTLAGEGLKLFGSAVSEAAKASIQILTKEVDKQTDSYHNIAAAGALFTDGITGMMKTSTEAEISIKTMSDIVKGNSEALYRSGLSIADATKLIGKTFQAGGREFKGSLLNLGYSLEEQGALVAETMQYMTIAGKNVKNMTGGEVAAATKDYAINLKSIAAITGEDAKKRMEQAREASANAAVQAKLARMDPAAREQFMADLALVPQELKNAVIQQRVLGTVTDKNANIMMATIPGMSENLRGMAESLGSGTVAVGQYREAIADNIKQANTEGSATAAMGTASVVGLSGAASDAANSLAKLTLEMQKGANERGDSARLTAEARNMANTTDEATQKLSSLSTQAGELTSTLEKQVNVHLKSFASVLEATNKKALEALGGSSAAASEMSNGPGVLGKYILPVAQIAAGAALGIGTSWTGIGGMAGAGIAMDGMSRLGKGYADGGVAAGPSSGYTEKLHGTELIVPMDSSGGLKAGTEGFNALVSALASMSPSSPNSDQMLVSEIRNLVKLVSEQNKLAEEANNARKTLIDITESHKRTADRILDAAT